MSRELDARIATEVMGLKWPEDRCRICGWQFAKTRDDGCAPNGDCSMRPMPSPRADEPAHYSTSISDAWEVVEKMRSIGYWLTLFSNFDSDEYNQQPVWEATFCNGGNNHKGAHLTSAPEAICLAALASLGQEGQP